MRRLVIAAFCVVLGTAFQAQAACTPATPEKNLPGYCCSILGKTVKDSTNENILACLCEATADCTSGYIWKALSKPDVEYICGSGKVLTAVKAGNVGQCVTPALKPVTLYKDINTPPPPTNPCAAVSKSCLGGSCANPCCKGSLGYSFPAAPHGTITVVSGGGCTNPDVPCPVNGNWNNFCHQSFVWTYRGTCLNGVWFCQLQQDVEQYLNGANMGTWTVAPMGAAVPCPIN